MWPCFLPLRWFFLFFCSVFLLPRFRVCAQSLPFGQTVAKNPGYFLQMIGDMIDYTDHLIRLSNKGNISCNLLNIWGLLCKKKNIYFFLLIPLCLYFSVLFFKGLVLGTKAQTGPVQREAVELIFSLSFLKVLSPHRSLYKDLLSHLHKRMSLLNAVVGTKMV